MNLIVAVDKKWGIGNKGKLLVSIPRDKKLFREETIGKVIIMGHNTLLALPGAQVLPERTNIVLSRDENFKVKDSKKIIEKGEIDSKNEEQEIEKQTEEAIEISEVEDSESSGKKVRYEDGTWKFF